MNATTGGVWGAGGGMWDKLVPLATCRPPYITCTRGNICCVAWLGGGWAL